MTKKTYLLIGIIIVIIIVLVGIYISQSPKTTVEVNENPLLEENSIIVPEDQTENIIPAPEVSTPPIENPTENIIPAPEVSTPPVDDVIPTPTPETNIVE